MRSNDLVSIEKLNEEFKIFNENLTKVPNRTITSVTVNLAMQHIYAKIKELNEYLEERL